MTQNIDRDGAWDAGWDSHSRAQRRRLAALPLAEKLRWLEEADEVVRHLRDASRSRNGTATKTPKARLPRP